MVGDDDEVRLEHAVAMYRSIPNAELASSGDISWLTSRKTGTLPSAHHGVRDQYACADPRANSASPLMLCPRNLFALVSLQTRLVMAALAQTPTLSGRASSCRTSPR
jgi:hypothetical protein